MIKETSEAFLLVNNSKGQHQVLIPKSLFLIPLKGEKVAGRAERRAGRLRAKSLSEQYFCEVVGVPGSEQSFIFDSKLFGFFVF